MLSPILWFDGFRERFDRVRSAFDLRIWKRSCRSIAFRHVGIPRMVYRHALGFLSEIVVDLPGRVSRFAQDRGDSVPQPAP